MRTVSITNLKGGVAKTSTAVNLAAILAKDYGERVLLIDADSQCNATEFYGGNPEKGNIAELLRKNPGGRDASWYTQASNFSGIDLLCGHESLMDLDLTKVEMGSAQVGVLKNMCEFLEGEDRYKWVIIDCPPAFNAASAAALLASDEVIIPMKLDAFSLRGMSNLMRQIQNMRKINTKLRLAGMLPTMWYKSENIMDAEAQLRRSGLPVFHHIRRTPTVDNMTFQQEPLNVSSPKSGALRDYRIFVEELRGGVQNG